MTGTVKYFNGAFGHIMADDKGKDIFVHVSTLPEGMVLHTGQEVEVDVHPTYRHPKNGTRRALSVHLLTRQTYYPIDQAPRRKAVAHGD
jgi:cold shock CspA family protein